MNSIASQEIQVISAIFGDDFSQQEIEIKEAWKASQKAQLFKIRVRAKQSKIQNSVFVDVSFLYPEEYPQQAPVFCF